MFQDQLARNLTIAERRRLAFEKLNERKEAFVKELEKPKDQIEVKQPASISKIKRGVDVPAIVTFHQEIKPQKADGKDRHSWELSLGDLSSITVLPSLGERLSLQQLLLFRDVATVKEKKVGNAMYDYHNDATKTDKITPGLKINVSTFGTWPTKTSNSERISEGDYVIVKNLRKQDKPKDGQVFSSWTCSGIEEYTFSATDPNKKGSRFDVLNQMYDLIFRNNALFDVSARSKEFNQSIPHPIKVEPEQLPETNTAEETNATTKQKSAETIQRQSVFASLSPRAQEFVQRFVVFHIPEMELTPAHLIADRQSTVTKITWNEKVLHEKEGETTKIPYASPRFRIEQISDDGETKETLVCVVEMWKDILLGLGINDFPEYNDYSRLAPILLQRVPGKILCKLDLLRSHNLDYNSNSYNPFNEEEKKYVMDAAYGLMYRGSQMIIDLGVGIIRAGIEITPECAKEAIRLKFGTMDLSDLAQIRNRQEKNPLLKISGRPIINLTEYAVDMETLIDVTFPKMAGNPYRYFLVHSTPFDSANVQELFDIQKKQHPNDWKEKISDFIMQKQKLPGWPIVLVTKNQAGVITGRECYVVFAIRNSEVERCGKRLQSIDVENLENQAREILKKEYEMEAEIMKTTIEENAEGVDDTSKNQNGHINHQSNEDYNLQMKIDEKKVSKQKRKKPETMKQQSPKRKKEIVEDDDDEDDFIE